MSEPTAERLSKFTPDATGLDRDALLFAAGRASVRPKRRWAALCGILAASQVATLTLLYWPAPEAPPIRGVVTPVANAPGSPEPPSPPAADASTIFRLRAQVIAGEGNLPSPGLVGQGMADEPPLVAASRPESLLQ